MVLTPPSSGPRWKRAAIITGVAAAVALLFCVCGGVVLSLRGDTNEVGPPAPAATEAAPAGTPVSQAAPAVPQAKVGDTVPVGSGGTSVDYTVVKTETTQTDEFGGAATTGIYLLAEIRVKVTKGEAVDGAFNWSFVGPSGTVYQTSLMPVNKRKAYTGGSLGAGQQATGWLVFDLPEDEVEGGKVQLELLELLGDNQRVTWQL